jgi:hypothetical protein
MSVHVDVEFVIRESMIHFLRDRRSAKGMVPYRPTQESIVNKLVLAFATVAVFGLSTAAFAQNPAASTQVRVQPLRSHAAVAHGMRESHRTDLKKVAAAPHRSPHRGMSHARHYVHNNGKKVVVGHMTTHKVARTKASS